MNDNFRRSVGFLVASVLLAAGSAEAHPLVAARTEVVDACLAKGIGKVHELDLRQLRAKILQLKYRRAEDQFPDVAGDRRTAYYRSGEVRFNTEEFPASFEMISLHEALGALGFADAHYEKSTALTAVCSHPEPATVINSDYVRWNFQAQKSLQVAGGSTVVGGGGDLVAAELKSAVVRAVMSETRAQISDTILLTQTAFEPSSAEEVVLKITPDGRSPHRGLLEYAKAKGQRSEFFPTVKFLVPRSLKPRTPEFTAVVGEVTHFFETYRHAFRGNDPAGSKVSCGNIDLREMPALADDPVWTRSQGSAGALREFARVCGELNEKLKHR